MTQRKPDPNREHILNDIFNLNLSECAIAICLASFQKDSITPKFEKLEIHESLSKAFSSIVSFTLEERKMDTDRRLLEYAFDSKLEPRDIEYLDLDESPYDIIKQQIEEVSPPKPTAGMNTIQNDERFLKGIRFYVIVVQPKSDANGDKRVCFFRSYTRMNKLRRGVLAALWFDQGYFDRVEEEKVFLFDEEVDCMSRGNTMFIFDKDRFHRMFHFYETLQKAATEILSDIQGLVPIDNFDKFGEDCKRNPVKIAKLKSIAKKTATYKKKLTLHNIQQVIAKYSLDVKIVTDNQDANKQVLQYDATKSWILLKLLDDDFLWSEMTEQSYEVTGYNGPRKLDRSLR